MGTEDDARFDRAFDALYSRALGHAQRLTGDPHWSEDIAAEALTHEDGHGCHFPC